MAQETFTIEEIAKYLEIHHPFTKINSLKDLAQAIIKANLNNHLDEVIKIVEDYENDRRWNTKFHEHEGDQG